MPVPASAVEPVAAATSGPRPRWITWLVRAGQGLCGLIAALLIAELGFRWRDHGAFPHLNLYVADAELGVRLAPGSEQKFQLRANPVTSIHVNSSGYRGAEWPAPSPGEILVVGDSQVFGLGVDDDETLSERLAALTHRSVLNGGVPTYGPLEYNAVVAELLARRKIATVVYVVNFANDLFEWNRPNRERHAVWDGWAVRRETAPASGGAFPGRHWLMTRSHLVYALRRWLAKDDVIDERGFASEGTWKDLVGLGEEVGQRHAGEQARVRAANQQKLAKLSETEKTLGVVEGTAEEQTLDYFALDRSSNEGVLVQAASGRPGDIVVDNLSEEGRSIAVTADLIRRGVAYRAKLEQDLRARADSKAKRRLLEVIDERDALTRTERELRTGALAQAHVPSVLEPRLREVKALCDQHGAELVVVALPLDVQVSAAEWKKYGVAQPLDMGPSRVLIDDLLASARDLGLRTVDATGPLASVDGAFLDHDIHMTARGVAAVAEAVAARLAGPPPLPLPGRDLPLGRTRVPSPAEWRATAEAYVAGSTKLRCETVIVREWLRVQCLREGDQLPAGITLRRGGAEAMTLLDRDAMSLVVPLASGEGFLAEFVWSKRRALLTATWVAGEPRPNLAFSDEPTAGAPAREPTADEARLCQCYHEVVGEKRCKSDELGDATGECEPVCDSLFGRAAPACFSTYGKDCAALLACAEGDPLFAPTCPDGEANALADGHCRALCSPAAPCAHGTCVPWQGSAVCE